MRVVESSTDSFYSTWVNHACMYAMSSELTKDVRRVYMPPPRHRYDRERELRVCRLVWRYYMVQLRAAYRDYTRFQHANPMRRKHMLRSAHQCSVECMELLCASSDIYLCRQCGAVHECGPSTCVLMQQTGDHAQYFCPLTCRPLDVSMCHVPAFASSGGDGSGAGGGGGDTVDGYSVYLQNQSLRDESTGLFDAPLAKPLASHRSQRHLLSLANRRAAQAKDAIENSAAYQICSTLATVLPATKGADEILRFTDHKLATDPGSTNRVTESLQPHGQALLAKMNLPDTRCLVIKETARFAQQLGCLWRELMRQNDERERDPPWSVSSSRLHAFLHAVLADRRMSTKSKLRGDVERAGLCYFQRFRLDPVPLLFTLFNTKQMGSRTLHAFNKGTLKLGKQIAFSLFQASVQNDNELASRPHEMI